MNKEHNCEIFGKKYSIQKLPIRQAMAIEVKTLALFAAIEKGDVSNPDALFEIGSKLLTFSIIDGQDIANEKDVEAYFEEAGLEEFNLAIVEAVKANFPKLMKKLDLSAVLDKVQGSLASTSEE
ncbi:hypothetical protein pA_gene0052 [Vibrio phage 13VT501A]|nr:hypothetical protein pA_gene0052 [Vibrio phage 13VT501A]